MDWASLAMIALVARLLCRELTLQNEYLLLENRTLRSKIPGRLRLTDEERRSLTEAALAMGRSLMKEVVSIVQPETILAWQRRLDRQKSDYRERRTRGPGRPRTPEDIDESVCRLARENTWGYLWVPRADDAVRRYRGLRKPSGLGSYRSFRSHMPSRDAPDCPAAPLGRLGLGQPAAGGRSAAAGDCCLPGPPRRSTSPRSA